jgi:hypothetical protein
MKRTFVAYQYRFRLVVLIVLMALVAALGAKAYLILTHRTLQQYADDVYSRCKSASYAPACYDKEIPALMDRVSMEDAFSITRLIQEKDSRYLYCHVLGHNVSYREASKDITKWKDVITRCPTNFCNNGCQHGALMRRFNAEHLTDTQIEEVKPDLMDVCEPRGSWHPTEVERSMCYHALGHLHMYITKADINKSVGLCNAIGVKSDGRNYVQTCTQGVLMTIYQPLEPEDYTLVRGLTPAKEMVNAFCDQFTGEAWYACHSESWPLFTQDIESPQGLMKFCSYTDDPVGKEKCVSTAMNILTVTMVVDKGNKLDALSSYCDQLPQPYNGHCYADAAFRLVQIDPRYVETASNVCDIAESKGVGDVCFRMVLEHTTHSFHAGSPESKAFCDHFKDPWKKTCFDRDKAL